MSEIIEHPYYFEYKGFKFTYALLDCWTEGKLGTPFIIVSRDKETGITAKNYDQEFRYKCIELESQLASDKERMSSLANELREVQANFDNEKGKVQDLGQLVEDLRAENKELFNKMVERPAVPLWVAAQNKIQELQAERDRLAGALRKIIEQDNKLYPEWAIGIAKQALAFDMTKGSTEGEGEA